MDGKPTLGCPKKTFLRREHLTCRSPRNSAVRGWKPWLGWFCWGDLALQSPDGHWCGRARLSSADFSSGGFSSARSPSLKLRMPSPSPRITSGIFLPPNNSTTMAKTISQWIGLNSPIQPLFGFTGQPPPVAIFPTALLHSITCSSPMRESACPGEISTAYRNRCGTRFFETLRAPVGPKTGHSVFGTP